MKPMNPTPGDWYYEAGDSGDPSVGLGPTPPTICVAPPPDSSSQEEIVLATLHRPCYPVATEADEWGSEGEHGDVNANGRLMAAAPALFAALVDLLEGAERIQEESKELDECPFPPGLIYNARKALSDAVTSNDGFGPDFEPPIGGSR